MKAETVNKCKILIGCFVIELLINGTARLSSIYFVESIARYDVGRQQASFPFVLTYMIKNLSGPLVGYLEQILGTKWIITVGCLMATLGIAGCFFAEAILVITLLWGVILGLSFGLAANMIPPLLNRCFNKSKNKANGFASSGSCVGGVVLPAMMVACIKTFGTSGSFLILSGILANCIPASLLIHNSSIKPKSRILKVNTELKNNSDSKNHKSIAEISNIPGDDSMVQTCKCLKNHVSENEYSKTSSNSNSSLNNYREKILNHIKETSAYDSYFPCTLHKNPSTKEESKNSNESQFQNRKFTLRYLRIFLDPTFIIILLINGLNTLTITALWTIILDFVKDKGVPENLEIYYVTLLPATDLLGRIGSGYVIDKSVLTLANFCLISFFGEAVTLVVIVYLKHYVLLMICEMLISFCIGMTVILDIAMTHDFIEEDSRKMAMSCRVMLYAPLSFTISPMIGYFRGGYGSYEYVFYILSVVSLFCGCAAYLLPHLAKSRRPLIPTNADEFSQGHFQINNI